MFYSIICQCISVFFTWYYHLTWKTVLPYDIKMFERYCNIPLVKILESEKPVFKALLTHLQGCVGSIYFFPSVKFLIWNIRMIKFIWQIILKTHIVLPYHMKYFSLTYKLQESNRLEKGSLYVFKKHLET